MATMWAIIYIQSGQKRDHWPDATMVNKYSTKKFQNACKKRPWVVGWRNWRLKRWPVSRTPILLSWTVYERLTENRGGAITHWKADVVMRTLCWSGSRLLGPREYWPINPRQPSQRQDSILLVFALKQLDVIISTVYLSYIVSHLKLIECRRANR
jgi:hypothetical protein